MMPAIYSLITSTRDPADPRLQWLRRQESPTVEVIVIANPGRVGLGAAYNEGLAKASGQFCCFLHDDVEIGPDDWLERFAAVLCTEEVDLLGVAGTICFPRSGGWWTGGVGTGRGVVTHWSPEGQTNCIEFGPPDDPDRPWSRVVSLDGVILFGRRDQFLDEPFDTEFFDGFHFYDSDLCFRWLLWRGRRLGVLHGLSVRHRLGVNLGTWQGYLNRFHYRHGGFLPLELDRAWNWELQRQSLIRKQPHIGRWLLSSRRPGELLGFEASVDRDDEAVAIVEDRRTAFRDAPPPPLAPGSSIVLQGAGAGRLLDQLLQQDVGRILVVEPEGHLLAWLFVRHDWAAAIDVGRLSFVLPAIDQADFADVSLLETLPAVEDWLDADPREAVWVEGGSYSLNRVFFESLRKALATPRQFQAQLVEEIRSGSSKDAVYDVTVVSPQCQIFNDLASCFVRLGLRVRRLETPAQPGQWTDEQWIAAVREWRSEWSWLTVFRNRAMLESFNPRHPLKVERCIDNEVLCWWWDVPNVSSMIEMRDQPACSRPALAFARDLLSLLPAGSQWLPPGARSEMVADSPSTAADQTMPLSFVGQSRFGLLQSNLRQLAAVLGYFGGRLGYLLARDISKQQGMIAIHRYLTQQGPDIRRGIETLRSASRWHGYFLNYLFEMCLTASFRLAAIETLKPFRPVVVGDAEWIQSGAAERDQFGGLIAPEKLRDLYRRTRLNLNLNFMQVSSTVNPKVLDISAAGAAVLTDWRPELADLFPDAERRPFSFQSLDDLPDIVADLLRRDLSDTTAAVHSQVLERHLLLHRAQTIAAQLGNSVP